MESNELLGVEFSSSVSFFPVPSSIHDYEVREILTLQFPKLDKQENTSLQCLKISIFENTHMGSSLTQTSPIYAGPQVLFLWRLCFLVQVANLDLGQGRAIF